MNKDIKMADLNWSVDVGDDYTNIEGDHYTVATDLSNDDAELIIEAVSEYAPMLEKIGQLEQALIDQVYRDTMLSDIAVRNGGVNLSLEGGACQLLANSFAEQFKESGATNYLEMSFDSMNANIGELVVTMHRKDGYTPGQLRSVAEAHNAELTEALDGLLSIVTQPSLDADETIPEIVKARAALSEEKG